jgi:hypothetical protein
VVPEEQLIVLARALVVAGVMVLAASARARGVPRRERSLTKDRGA